MTIGFIHLAASIIALVSGGLVLSRRKGTRSHRLLGWVYVASMLVLIVTAMGIYRLFGGFGPFHVAAIISLLTLVLGIRTLVASVRRRRMRAVRTRKWAEQHYYWMAYSYLGLMAAAVAEVATRFPGARPGQAFGIVVVITSVLVFVAGSRMIRRRADRIISSVSPRAG